MDFITTERRQPRGEDIKQESVKEQTSSGLYVTQNYQMISTNNDEVRSGFALAGVAEEDIQSIVYQALKAFITLEVS